MAGADHRLRGGHVLQALIDVRAMRWLETVPSEPVAHTAAPDGLRYCLYVFPPPTYRAAVVADGGPIGLSACPLLRAK
jgi:hypothetical protein